MHTNFDNLTIRQLLSLRENNMLAVNSEYQRGAVWSEAQQKRLIDSVMREYPLPLIYLHHIKREVAGMQREDLEIIDGQQRINALYYFSQNAFRLFDPIKDDKQARFPEFIRRQPCPWGARDFQGLALELRERFLDTTLSVAKITTDLPHEARDLFIRLQAGLPLNAQEKRDAWPGGFTEFVLRYGGKPEITRYQGHEFFRKLVPAKSSAGRGKNRQLCAQMAMLFLARRESGAWTDISTRAVDDYYYRHLDFDCNSANADRFGDLLTLVVSLLGDGKRRSLKGHEAIHVLLFVDSLKDEYTASWQGRFAPAFDRFMELAAKDKLTRNSPTPGEFWTQYDVRTRTDSDRGETIRLRHEFFTRKMMELMGPVQMKDATRGFGEVERELIYFRDQKRCVVCGKDVVWAELEIHHVEQHTFGGPTNMENGVTVHSACHPKGRAADEFRQAFADRAKEPPGIDGGAAAPGKDER
jgi:hypothetical protein